MALWSVLLISGTDCLAQRLDFATASGNPEPPSRDTTVPHFLIPQTVEPERGFHLTAAGITIPAALIGIGASGLSTNSPMYKLNHSTAKEIYEDHPHFYTWVDDYLKYLPAAATAALEAAGVKGKHTAGQTAIIYAISYAIMGISTEAVKHIARETRPDGTDDLSFPSGHTATAFASAELMRLEFKDTHPLLAWSGYLAALGTGALRMYKQRHYAGDVAAGAGVGILSTEAAYLIYPVLQRTFSRKQATPKVVLLPAYDAQWKTAGVNFTYHF
ncbi:PAP2 superfamily protein [Chitinophaga costaii]|uniref:PAP2 superfamily protein n=1 Tax=Chitinophaga costaii TaxID=1335309 RepID=A0A1C4BJ48_9BACT|nr:PAP2 superfamily protein [Chitinophaga costaii]